MTFVFRISQGIVFPNKKGRAEVRLTSQMAEQLRAEMTHQTVQCVCVGAAVPLAHSPRHPPPPQARPQALTMRSGGGVLRMKHLIWPFSPCRACWVWVLEMMGGPVGETASYQRIGRGGPLAGPLATSSEVYTSIHSADI